MDLILMGKKLKNLRISNGLTLDELAARSELSKGFLSQLERGQMSPSLENLNYILESLGITLGEFFKDNQLENKIIFEDNYLSRKTENGIIIKWLIPTSQRHAMEPISIIISPNSEYIIKPFEGEIFGKVISGELVLVNGKKEAKLTNKNTFYIEGKDHLILKSTKESEVLLVSTPPIF